MANNFERIKAEITPCTLAECIDSDSPIMWKDGKTFCECCAADNNDVCPFKWDCKFYSDDIEMILMEDADNFNFKTYITEKLGYIMDENGYVIGKNERKHKSCVVWNYPQ